MDIKSTWDSYKAEVVPENAHEVQVLETKRAFYAGVSSAMNIITNKVADMEEEEAMTYLDGIEQELNQFVKDQFKGAYQAH